jgi:hypothetical protein
MTNRIAAFLCFLESPAAVEGMQALAELGYHSVVLSEIVDECSTDTTYVEASKPLPEGTDISGRWRFDCGDRRRLDCAALDEIQDAIGHLGDCCEARLVDDKKIDWCGGAT